MRQRVYLAGPYSADPDGCTETAIKEGQRLLEAGYAPFVPHLSHFWEKRIPNPYSAWLELDFAWVVMADALVRLPGESSGADEEEELAQEWGIPIYHGVDELLANPPVRGDERFHKTLRSLAMLHDRKQADYGATGDPFANVRGSQDWGVSPWVGAGIRLNDKVRRLQSFARKGKLHNEAAEDSMLDISVYAVIMLILYGEGK